MACCTSTRAQTETFAEAQGLPDPQVQSLAISGDTTYAGTPLGVAVFSAGRFSRVLAPGVLATALLATPTQLYVGSEDQGVIADSAGRPSSEPEPGARLRNCPKCGSSSRPGTRYLPSPATVSIA